MSDQSVENEFKKALQFCSLAKTMGDDLPDGMGEELLDARREYSEHKDKELFISEVSEIVKDWGFVF